jgi:hypothetical protein
MGKNKKRVSKHKDSSTPSSQLGDKRQRNDSNHMDEYFDYKRMKCIENIEKKWCKFNSLLNKDPNADLVLFSVPRGFPIENLNSVKIDGSEEFDME